MPSDRDKSTIGKRLTGAQDPKDPDGLLTVDQAASPPSRTAYGHEETDTLDVENQPPVSEATRIPKQNGITSADTTGQRSD
ncbi:MAG: hypothetical protein JWO98_5493 [Frankiales bacterium]|nr:hypothetical protein [Frankiales bacterium]